MFVFSTKKDKIKIKALKVLMEDDFEDIFFPYDTALNSKSLVPHQGGSVVSKSNYDLVVGLRYPSRQTSFLAYFHLSLKRRLC